MATFLTDDGNREIRKVDHIPRVGESYKAKDGGNYIVKKVQEKADGIRVEVETAPAET